MEEAIDVVAKQLKEERVAAEQVLQAFNDGALAKSRRDATLELADKRGLSEITSWTGMPHACSALFATFDCHQAAAKADSQAEQVLSKLESQWRQRHFGIPPACACDSKAKRQSPCSSSGTCLCRNQGLLHKFLNKVNRATKACCSEKEDRDDLIGGRIVILWTAYGATNNEEEQREEERVPLCQRVTHVALQYLRPYRATYVEARHASLGDAAVLQRFALNAEAVQDQDSFVTLQLAPENDDGGAMKVMSSTQFLESLNMDWVWDMHILKLSAREHPFPLSDGLVRARLLKEKHVTTWLGAEAERVRRRPLHHRLNPPGQEENAAHQSDHESLRDEGEEENNDDGDSDGSMQTNHQSSDSGSVDTAPDPLDFPEDVLEHVLRGRPESQDGTSSSSSSSSSSDSSSRSSGHGNGRPNHEQAPGGLAGEAPDAVEGRAALARQRRPESGPWGRGFYFTLKPPPHRGAAGAWQALCRYHLGQETFEVVVCTGKCSPRQGLSHCRPRSSGDDR